MECRACAQLTVLRRMRMDCGQRMPIWREDCSESMDRKHRDRPGSWPALAAFTWLGSLRAALRSEEPKGPLSNAALTATVFRARRARRVMRPRSKWWNIEFLLLNLFSSSPFEKSYQCPGSWVKYLDWSGVCFLEMMYLLMCLHEMVKRSCSTSFTVVPDDYMGCILLRIPDSKEPFWICLSPRLFPSCLWPL